MGALSHFNLNDYINKYNSEFLIETGTYRGDAINYALKFKFKKLFSVELLKENYDICVDKFKANDSVILINDSSVNGLFKILHNYDIGNTIFWLDAHLPNFYDKSYSSDYMKDKEILIPLEEELKTIVNNKDVKNDVFIIDDLRIYEKGNFKKGEWLGVIDSGQYGIDFIYKLLGKTHNIERNYDDEGYIICTV
jgi:hypothetical protein